MKRISIALGLFGIGLAQATYMGATVGVGKIGMDNANAGLLYFTNADGSNFPCVGSGDDKIRMYVPAGFSADQRKSYLAVVLTARAIGAQVGITFDNSGSGGKCELISMELQN